MVADDVAGLAVVSLLLLLLLVLFSSTTLHTRQWACRSVQQYQGVCEIKGSPDSPHLACTRPWYLCSASLSAHISHDTPLPTSDRSL